MKNKAVFRRSTLPRFDAMVIGCAEIVAGLVCLLTLGAYHWGLTLKAARWAAIRAMDRAKQRADKVSVAQQDRAPNF